MSVQAYDTKVKVFGKKKRQLAQEDIIILSMLEQLKKDLDLIHSRLDLVTDPVLIDSFIYEMNALNMRYKFYLRQCKDKGIVGKLFSA